jgi:DNA-binding CsgD family transcriptional regulator
VEGVTSWLCDYRLPFSMARQVALYGAVGGVLIALLKLIEYKHFVHEYPSEIYGGLVALIFTTLGIYFGLRWTRAKQVVVIREVPVRMDGPFILNAERLKGVGLTPREHEILALIAQGLSNREIGEKLFVSENTVKTHSSRLFEKMQVNRRVQAVQKGKDLGLIP